MGVPSLDRLQFSHTYGADPGYRWLRLAVVNVDEFSNVSDEIFTYPSLQPLLSLVDAETLNGSGSPLDPWISGPLASHVLQLELQDSTAVTADPLSEFLLHGPAGAALTGNMLDFDATASGDYYVTATYDGVPSAPYSLHFHINVAPQAVLSADHTSGHVPLAVLLDGSQSSDTDGEIVLAEWDFDNDGTFDADSGNQLTISHTYSSEGSFEAVLRLTDDGGASSLSDPLAITVLPPNQPPLADLQAFPTSGNTPLLVSLDASASSDPDGTLSLADWDFDNDGIFDLSGTAELVIDHVYTVPGDYQAVVRVYDDDAAFADSDPVAISVGGNFPPVPVLTAVPYSGLSPLSVLLDASASSDPDGEIVLVEWDFSGDGEYDQSGTQLSTGHLYTGDGEFHAMVRLTDNDGGVSVSAPVTVTVGVEAGSAPLALLSADPLFGAAPLLVTLDASGSTDPDDDIVLTEFDFDNDGSWDEQDAEDYITTHEYALDGSYEVRLRVTDAEGHRSVSDPLTIIVNSSAPPTAVFTAVSFSGTAPFDVVADASASMDPDGLIALYEWDADDDGIFEYSTTQNDAQFSLLAVGSYTIHLRVTDNDGLSHAVSHDFTVQPGSLSWQDYGTGIANPLNAHYAVSGGRPAVAWQSSLADIYFKRSADSAGHSWPVSGVLVDGNLTDYPGGSMRLLDFAVSGGVPLMVSIKGTNAQADHDMFICRGLNADGSSFATPQKIISGLQNRVDRDLAGWPLLADFSGLPAICYGSDQSGAWQHIRALDSQGVGWPAAVDAVNGSRSASLPIGSLLSDPAGGAQLFYFSNNQISTNRDPNGDGVGWNARQDLFSESGVVRVQAIASSGSVVLLYAISTGAGNIELYASHADSPAYTAWSSPFPVASLAASPADCQLLLDNGKPALLVSGNLAGLNGVQYLRSHDARGSHWSTPQRISSQSGGELRGAAFVNGHLTAMHLRSNGILRLLSRE